MSEIDELKKTVEQLEKQVTLLKERGKPRAERVITYHACHRCSNQIDVLLDTCPYCKTRGNLGKPHPDYRLANKKAMDKNTEKKAEKIIEDNNRKIRVEKEISDHASASGKKRRDGLEDDSVGIRAF